MKASLQLKINQQLAMTPQLQQSIRFLQLSSLELQQEIQLALETNPLLAMNEDEVTDNTPELTNDSEHEQASPAKEATNDQPPEHNEDANISDHEWHDEIPIELTTDSAWEDVFQNTQGSSGQTANNSLVF